MDHKIAIQILIKMLEAESITADEKEALRTAIGVLSWTSLKTGRLNAMKEKKMREGNKKT